MAGPSRGAIESAIVNELATFGWSGSVSKRLQARAFPGVTPATPNPYGKGRGPVMFDAMKECPGGILAAKAVGLKAATERPTTVTITTGKGDHVKSVIKAALSGTPILLAVCSTPGIKISGKSGKVAFEAGNPLRISDLPTLDVALIRVGELIRDCGGRLPRRTQGQGRGRGQADALSWGFKSQTAASGKVYEYMTIQSNLAEAGAEWMTLGGISELANLLDDIAEDIYL